ncbi:MAG: cytochrome c biogenesis protein CcsA [Magnetococcus sp. WYHC-3]
MNALHYNALQYSLALLFYGAGAGIIIHHHFHGVERPSRLSWVLVMLGWGSQGWWMGNYLGAQGGMLAVGLAASLQMSGMALGMIYLVGWWLRPREVRASGLLLVPLMILFLLASAGVPGAEREARHALDPVFFVHLVLSLLAYGLISVAAVVALLDGVQEWALRTKHFNPIFQVMPALGALETALFATVRWGWVLLTLSIVTGAWVSHDALGVWLTFSHKVLLSLLTWGLFAVLLVGHWRWGWRGRRVVRWTVTGYLFLVLGFLGVKFVTEILLGR